LLDIGAFFCVFFKIRPKIRRVVKVMQRTITGPQKLQSAKLYSS
jgi:sulfur relay (sulfurtransferase) DsrC/TusE family protein